jgi:hypothetical protein
MNELDNLEIPESNTILYKHNFNGIKDLRPANEDKKLSWGAWGILTYLWQQNNFCKINKKNLVQIHKASYYKIGNMLQELRKQWYLFYFPFYKNGRVQNWVWSLHSSPNIIIGFDELDKYKNNLIEIVTLYYKSKGE